METSPGVGLWRPLLSADELLSLDDEDDDESVDKDDKVEESDGDVAVD